MKNLLQIILPFSLIICCLSVNAQNIIRGPYLQSVNPQGVHIKWRTDDATSSKVWYGISPTNLSATAVAPGSTQNHEVVINGLSPNTRYFYAVGNNAGQLQGGDNMHYFKTSPTSSISETINIWVLGDAGKRSIHQTNVRNAFYDHHGDEDIDLMLLLGDNAYLDGTDEEYQGALFEDMYEDRLINSTMFSAYGNHDSYSADSYNETGPYFDIFTFPKNGELGGVPSQNESYYSFNYGDIHVVSINGHDEDVTEGSDQLEWLKEDLAANTKNWVIAIFHFPIYDGRSDNASDGNTRERAMRENVGPVLEQYGADLVLMGHSHTYQRSFLLDGHYGKSNTFDPGTMAIDMGDGQTDGDGPYQKNAEGKGTVYMVAGSAGSINNDDLDHPVMYYSDNEYGSVRLQIINDELYAEFISREGTVDDYFTIKKDLPPPNNQDLDCPALGTYIGAPCNDNNAATYDDAISEDCICTGIPFDCPIELANIGTPCDDGNPNTYLDVLTDPGDCNCAGFPIGNATTVTVSVSQNNDDAEESEDGEVAIASSDLEITEDDDQQVIGVRFDEVGIPAQSIITNAYIQFTVDETLNSNSCELTIYGEDRADAGSFTYNNKNISQRTKTETAVNWSPEPWTVKGQATAGQRTADLSAIIQEIISRPDYEYNNALAFLITGNCRRVAVSYDKSPANAPRLVIEYATACADENANAICDDEEPCPGTSLVPGQPCDDDNPQTINDVITQNCTCAGIIPGGNNNTPVTVTMQVVDSDDDAEQGSGGYISLGSSDLELMQDGSVYQRVGIRFQNVAVPRGATIDNAYIQFVADETTEEANSEIKIFGEYVDNALPFEKQNYNVSSRERTMMHVNWSPNMGWTADDMTESQKTNDLKELVQEIVNRPGYQQGNAIAFIFDGTGKSKAVSFDGDTDKAARLIITYTQNCPDTDNDGICNDQDVCPLTQLSPGDPCDDNNPATFNDVLDGNCNCVGGTTVGTTCSRISAGTDDVEERLDGRMRMSSTDIELVTDDAAQLVGLRFTNLEIPIGSVITNANINFTVDETNNTTPCNLIVMGEVSLNSATFEDEPNSVSDRDRTNAQVLWTPEEWTSLGATEQTINIAPVIQEIIDQPGFQFGAPITIIISGEGTRYAESFEGNTAAAPELCVDYNWSSANINSSDNTFESASDMVSEYKLGVYPNPAIDIVNVLLKPSKEDRLMDVQIMDVAGKVVYTDKVLVKANEGRVTFEELNLNAGSFLIQLHDGQKSMSGRFVVVRM